MHHWSWFSRPDTSRGIPTEFLLFWLRFQEPTLAISGTGSTFTAINKNDLEEVDINIPPLAEQKRIVAKVEALLARVNAARERLAKVPHILKRFRQAVLAAACSGRLTEDWRALHPQIRPATEAVRAQLDRLRAFSAETSNSSAVRGDVTSDLPTLPETWEWVPLGLLGEDPLNPVQTGPFGALLHRDEFVAEGVPVIAVGNLTGMEFTTEGLYYITSQKAQQLARFDVNAGDLLFARSGATLGKVCVAPDYVRDWRMTGHILRARLSKDVVLPSIAVFALWGAPPVLEQVREKIRGVTRPGYNTSLLESVVLPVPPLPEQHEIVRQVEALFKLADAIEKRVVKAMERAERLTQAILAKAFRGELVPTEAELARHEARSYEPASALLACVKAERASQELFSRQRKAGEKTNTLGE